jgi:hypothetical protein
MNRIPLLSCLCAFAALASGCAHPAAPGPAPLADEEAAERARRGERLKIMQEYWREQAAGEAGREPGPFRPPPLEYPAGNYSGLNFGPRVARDPALTEPDR